MLKIKIRTSKKLLQLFLILVLTIFIVPCCLKLHSDNNQLFQDPKANHVLNLSSFHYIISSDICFTDNVFLLILIHSASSHFSHRQIIRKTWGKPDSNVHKKVQVVFLLAADPKLQNEIEHESYIYKDIVQSSFIDSYRNLTYKHAMGLKWATENCAHAKYLMKMDDDIFIDIFQWLGYVVKNISLSKLKKSIACFVQRGMPVVRDPVSKWYVSKKEYNSDVFEDYCSGWAYLTSISAAYDLLKALQTLDYFWVDDVHVTGTAAEVANISHIRLNDLYDLESDGITDWSSINDNMMWNKIFAPTWNDLNLTRVAYKKTLKCWVTDCKCCYSRKTTVKPTKVTTSKGIAKLLYL